MPSPDVTPYVDLTLYDKDPQDIYAEAALNAQSYITDWVPREGNTEVVLMESLALEVAESVYALNRLPGAIMEALMRLYGIDKDLGTPPTTTLTFTVGDTLGHEIPIGTRASLDIGGGVDPITFATDVGLIIPAGSTTGTVSATGDRNTDIFNNTPTGSAMELVDAVVFVESVILGSDVVGGVSPESDTDWLNRGAQRFQRLTEVLVLPKHFTERALEEVYVYRATTIDNYDPAVGPNPGDNAGNVTVAVYGTNGPVDQTDKDALLAAMQDQIASNLTVHIVDPTVTPVDVTTNVVVEPGYLAATVQANVEAALNNYLSTSNWDWSSIVRRNSLIQVIGTSDGVAYVDTLDVPAADVNLPGVAPLAEAGTITVTTTGP